MRVPALTEPKFNPEGTSAEIDQRVKKIVGDALSVYRVDADKLRELRPDVIVTQSQCEVCAVSERDVEAAVAEWLGTRPKIVSLAPYGLDDIFTDMQGVADALDARARGTELVERLRLRLGKIADQAREASQRPGVATIEWIDPMMAAGNWMPTLVEMAGAANLFGKAGEHSPWMKFEELACQGSGSDFDFAMRLRHGSRCAGPACADQSSRMERTESGARAPRVHGRWQPVFQSPRSANR